MKQAISKHKYFIIIGTIIFTLLPFILEQTGFISSVFLINDQLHAVLEAVGAFICILITVVLYARFHNVKDELVLPFIALGFLGIGIFDLYHAVSLPGNRFVLSHILSGLSGAVFFAFVLLPAKIRAQISIPNIFKIVITIWILIILYLIIGKSYLPQMTTEDNKFTTGAIMLSFITGIAFLASAISLLKKSNRLQEDNLFYFALVALIEAVARFTFANSQIWNTEWWFWHALRIAESLLIFYVALKYYLNMINDLNLSLKNQGNILNAMPFGMMIIDSENKMIQINKAAEKITGFNSSNIANKLCFDTVCGSDCNTCMVTKTGDEINNLQQYVRNKDGQKISVIKSVVPIKFNNKDVLLEGFVDITETIKAQENLKLNEQKFREIFDSMVSSVFIINLEGTIVDVNRKACEQYEYSKDEFLKMSPTQFIHHDYLGEFERFMDDLKQKGSFKGHTIDLKKNGQGFHTDVSGTLISINNIPHLLAVVTDISEKVRDEHILNITLQDLTRSNKELEQFAYVASHDLQEPLRKIKNYTDLIQQTYTPKLDEKGIKYMTIVSNGAARMQTLINDLLTISRISQTVFNLEKVDLNNLVKSAVDELKTTIIASHATINYHDLPVVDAEPEKLKQVFIELLSNSIKFNMANNPVIEILHQENKDSWQIEVKDNGIGIEEDYYNKIFVIFQRLHPRDKYPGNGVGLTICKKIIERHGGSIWCKSLPEQGTSLLFTIPK